MKRIPIVFAVLLSLGIISFKLYLFYSGAMESKLGVYSNLIILGLLIPLVFACIFLSRRANGGVISGREASKQGLKFVAFSTIVIFAFNYLFFEFKMKDYIRQYLMRASVEDIIKEQKKMGKTLTIEQANQDREKRIEQLSGFRYATANIFGILFIGGSASFIMAMFMKRAPLGPPLNMN